MTRRKKISAAKDFEHDRLWTRRSVYAKIGWTRPIGAEKTSLNRWNSEGRHGREEKTKLFWRGLVPKGFAPPAWKETLSISEN